jgi:hypothetical protein
MQNLLKNKGWEIGAVAAFAAAVVLLLLVPKTNAQPSSINVQTTAVATTTLIYVGNGTATSTYQIDSYPTFSSSKIFSMAGIDSEYLFIQVNASSSATVFSFTPQFSNNGIDWYNYGTLGTPATNGNTAVSTSTAFTWTPGTTATTSMAFKLPDLAGMHERIMVSAT